MRWFLCVVATGCSAEDRLVAANQPASLTVLLGAAGGAIDTGAGLTLDVPPGALAGPTEITAFTDGIAWEVAPVDAVLLRPAELCLALTDNPGPNTRITWTTVDGRSPQVTRWDVPGWACATIGRFGTGRVEDVASFAGRPEVTSDAPLVSLTQDGWQWDLSVETYHPDGVLRTTQVRSVFPDGSIYGMLTAADTKYDQCDIADAWTYACSQSLQLDGPAPGWVQISVLDEDNDHGDWVTWEVPQVLPSLP